LAPHRPHRPLPGHRRARLGRHDAGDQGLVRRPREALLQSAQLDLWSGLVDALRPHGLFSRQARRTFFIILLVNSLWSLLFFGMHRPDLALIDILGYLILLIIWIRQLWPQHRVAALLQIPHLLWVSFATVLNVSIWWLNK
jgi:hypothetical protein